MTPLRQRMIEDMRLRNFSPKTQHSYLGEIFRFARHFGKSPDLLGPAEIRSYCLHLIQDRHLSAGSMKVAQGAIRFLYKVTLRRDWNLEEEIPVHRAPKKLPAVLSQQEVRQFLDAVRNLKHRTILTTCGACPRAGHGRTRGRRAYASPRSSI
jgi:integrase/recombinase XerD